MERTGTCGAGQIRTDSLPWLMSALLRTPGVPAKYTTAPYCRSFPAVKTNAGSATHGGPFRIPTGRNSARAVPFPARRSVDAGLSRLSARGIKKGLTFQGHHSPVVGQARLALAVGSVELSHMGPASIPAGAFRRPERAAAYGHGL